MRMPQRLKATVFVVSLIGLTALAPATRAQDHCDTSDRRTLVNRDGSSASRWNELGGADSRPQLMAAGSVEQ
jgi:hypothetical protein